MTSYLGILFALIALFAWGFGDFFIQRTTRSLGIWKTLFFIGVVAFISLTPFVWREISHLTGANIMLLLLLALVNIFGTLFDFEALREGKIAIIEPLLGIELPITAGLAVLIGHDMLSLAQVLLIGIVFVGMVLAVTVRHEHLRYHKRLMEKGVILAGVGAIGLALTNFLVGTSSQQISPLLTMWFLNSLMGVICAIYLIRKGTFKTIFSELRAEPKLIAGQAILDNTAWVSFAIATTHIPISIATAISESYIAVGVLLGVFLNKEKIQRHQAIGVIVTVIAIVMLSAITPE